MLHTQDSRPHLGRVSTMALSTLVAALLISCMLVILFVRSKSRSIGILRGPPRFSRLFGYELELLHQENVGDHEFQWVDEYGSAFRVPDVYGTDSLWLVDPRALQHILHTSGYNYTTPRDVDFDLRGFLGMGLFSSVFQFYASKLVKRIEDQIFIKPSEPVDMAKLIPKLTLDVIGETGFSYHFGALDDETTELSEKLLHIFDDSKMPTKFQVLMKSLRRYLPPVISEMTRVLPTKEDIRFAEFHHTADRIAENLVKEKEKEQRIQNNTTGSDILDILYHSNNAEDPKKRITNEELISQLSTLVLAGHDTTAFSIAWFLYELSAHPQDQRKIMEEIKAARAQSRTGEFTISDYDSMTHLNASMKEVLRLHPIVNRFVREAGRDDVLPLQFPVTTRNGEVVDNIPVKKGQRIEIAIAPYNRFAAVWGKDAHDFRPSRFLDIDTKKQTALGLYNNLIVEIQTVIVGLLERLEFSLPEGGLDMQRPPGLVMHPIVKGKEEEGPHLPLVVRPRVI
ncbi:cytochrome p450 [Moniliophthora roreri]|nr:cytochrome p450 [Moniliophthora roreri]